MVQTHINAYYRDLADAKTAVAVAQGRVQELEQQIVGQGGELPTDGVVIPQAVPEDVVTNEDVSAVETASEKPLDKLNRTELNAKAKEAGVDSPEDLDTKKDVIDAIKGAE